MSIESINAAQKAVNFKNQTEAKEKEATTTQQSYGSTKDIVATLGVLASIGVATAAIIKSKARRISP